MQFRDVKPSDGEAIKDLIEAAFRPEDVRSFYTQLKTEGVIAAEYVAHAKDRIIGHISFVSARIEAHDTHLPCLMLTPLSVAPGHQRQGVGAGLMNHAHARLQASGHCRFLVLGHPEYYPKFGYRHDLAKGIESPWSQYEAFMGLGNLPETGRLVISETVLKG